MSITASGGDDYARAGGWLSRIDPRVKIGGVAGLLAANLLGAPGLVPAMIILAMALLMVAGGIPYRRQLMMIAFPSSFAMFAIASQTVFKGTETFVALGPFDLHADGLAGGLLLALRILAGGLIVVVLGATTPLGRLCLALRWLKVPATFVEVLQLTYRYLFDIHGEYARMRAAQRSRLGWSSAATGLGSSRLLGGSLFLRVYERGLRSSEAMRCRGAGAVVGGALPAPGRREVWAGLALALLMALLIIVSLGVRP